MSKASKPSIADLKTQLIPLGTDLANMFTGIVSDVTDPRFISLLEQYAQDAIALATIKLQGAPAEQVKIVEDALKARGQSFLAVPGLVSAARTAHFMRILGSVSNVLVGFATNALTGYIGVAASALTKGISGAIPASKKPEDNDD